MLRVLKEKAKGDTGGSVASGREGIAPSPQPDHPTQHLSKTKLISHIPVSVGSNSYSPSPESSLSSRSEEEEDDYYCCCSVGEANVTKSEMGRPEKTSRDCLGAQKDSHGESRDIIADTTPCTRLPSTTCPSKHFSRCRKVSIVADEDISASSPAYKKIRVTSSTHGVTLSSSGTTSGKEEKITLLSRVEDDAMLSPLHAFIRKQIEVFTATAVELREPAPGRKQPIKLNQVGLRCIHCKNNPGGRRVKRAVCYPSNVGRVYHSVSDMKFDHFNNCRSLPPGVKVSFESLKAEGTKKGDKSSRKGISSSTAQYYQDSAMMMGMYDGPGGIFIAPMPWEGIQGGFLPSSLLPKNLPSVIADSSHVKLSRKVCLSPMPQRKELSLSPTKILNPPSFSNILSTKAAELFAEKRIPIPSSLMAKASSSNQTRIILREDSDVEYLNEIHCFVRQHVEVFAANKDDTASPAPGRKTRIVLGQVGIRCIHCANLAPKHRVKRAICYPPAVSGIYHAVSNMKFDHFAICRGLPEGARKEFAALRDSCRRKGNSSAGSSSNSTRGGGSSSTAKYYLESALRKGLTDTDNGIRLRHMAAGNKPSMPVGMSALFKAACQAA